MMQILVVALALLGLDQKDRAPNQGERPPVNLRDAGKILPIGILGTPRGGYTLGTIALAYSPDGRYLVSGGEAVDREPGGATLFVREAASGKVIRKLVANGDGIRCLAFSRDGSLLATGGEDGRIWLWDTATWTVWRHLGEKLPPTSALAISPDGKTLASCDWGGDPNDPHSVLLWDCVTGRKIGELNPEAGAFESICFSPDGKTLAFGGWLNNVLVWDVAGARELHRLQYPFNSIRTVAFSPDGKSLAALNTSAEVRIWSPEDGRLLRTFDGSFGVNGGFPKSGYMLGYTPDGKNLAIAVQGLFGGRSMIFLTDASSGGLIEEFYVKNYSISDIGFSPDGKTLASSSAIDDMIRVWDVATAQEKRPPSGHAGSIESIAFTPDGRRLATGGDDHAICIWDERSRGELLRCEGHEDSVETVAFSPDGSKLASASIDRTVRLWDAATGRPLHVWKHEAGIDAIAFSPDGSALTAADWDGLIISREVVSGKELARWLRTDKDGNGSTFDAIAYALKGGVFAMVDGHELCFWRQGEKEPFRVVPEDGVNCLAVSPEGLLLVAGYGCPMSLYDPASGEEVRRFPEVADSEGHRCVALSRDGKRIATGGYSDDVRIWDVESGRVLRVYPHREDVTSVSFSPDGSTLATTSEDRVARLWACP